jgi:hypothetical protein
MSSRSREENGCIVSLHLQFYLDALVDVSTDASVKYEDSETRCKLLSICGLHGEDLLDRMRSIEQAHRHDDEEGAKSKG